MILSFCMRLGSILNRVISDQAVLQSRVTFVVSRVFTIDGTRSCLPTMTCIYSTILVMISLGHAVEDPFNERTDWLEFVVNSESTEGNNERGK